MIYSAGILARPRRHSTVTIIARFWQQSSFDQGVCAFVIVVVITLKVLFLLWLIETLSDGRFLSALLTWIAGAAVIFSVLAIILADIKPRDDPPRDPIEHVGFPTNLPDARTMQKKEWFDDPDLARLVQNKLAALGYQAASKVDGWTEAWSLLLIEFAEDSGLIFSDPTEIAAHLERTPLSNLKKRPVVPLALQGDWYSVSCSLAPQTAAHRFDAYAVKTDAGVCVFTEFKANNGHWLAKANCSVGDERWSTDIKIEFFGDRIKWTSKRGIATYIKCPR